MTTTDIPWGELTWADQMIERGKREALLRQLRLRFGEVPASLVSRIEEVEGPTLDELIDRVVTVASLDEFAQKLL